MTAIVALENASMDKVMTASKEAITDIGVGGMNIGIMEGEQLLFEDLLNAMLIRSANETANIIAENICETRDAFVELMNKKAIEIGAVNSHFVNPSGLHHPDHYTTASDLAKIACYAMAIPEFREIVIKDTYNMPPTNKHQKWDPLPSTNKLLTYSPKSFTHVTGIKTGYTSNAGYNLVSSGIDSEGNEIIAVVLGGQNSIQQKINSLSIDLLEYGFENFVQTELVKAGQLIRVLHVNGSTKGAYAELVAESTISCLMPRDSDQWQVDTNIFIDENISAPVNEGTVLGKIQYCTNGIILGETALVAANSVEKSFKNKVSDALSSFFENKAVKNTAITTSIIFVFFFALRFTLRRISRKVHVKSRMEGK